MRTTFERGVEGTFFAVVIGLIVVAITMGFNARSWDEPYKPKSLKAMDEKQIEGFVKVSNPPPTPPPEESGFEPPFGGEDTPLPAETPYLNTKPLNLLNFLHHYYFLDDERMLTESVEYVDRETGYVKIGYKADSFYALPHTGKHVKYLLVLAKHKYIHPTLGIFDEDYTRMNNLVREIFETQPGTSRYTEESFFDLLELYRITGEDRYLEYAEFVNNFANLRNIGETYALLEQRRVARSFSPGNLNLVSVLQYYSDHGDPLLVQAAKLLFDGLMSTIYDDSANLFYQKATYGQHENTSLNVIETYKTSELAVGLYRLIDYYEATGDETVLDYVADIVGGLQSGESLVVDNDYGLYYSKALHKGSDFKNADKRADINLMMYGALFQYFKYNDSIDYFYFMREVFAFVDDVVYDSTYNGFYTRYSQSWEPLEDKGMYRLSITDALIGTQVFLDNQEVNRATRGAAFE